MSQKELNIGNLTLRFLKDGTLDEVITHDADGECEFHMEKMDADYFWMRFYSTKNRPLEKDLIVWMKAYAEGGAKLTATYDVDDQPTQDEIQRPEHREPLDKLTKEIKALVRNWGMKRILEQLLAHIREAKEAEKKLENRDVGYLAQLESDLQLAYNNYEARYAKEEAEWLDKWIQEARANDESQGLADETGGR